ncbi:hypothetical protein LVX13_37525 [Streptomyces albulus]|uniref:HNH endonuclease n=1 Tax=Streptomyces noursei TaxID=1971 RepID=UPI001F1E3774|nr:HNH endonuclease [Streptomyces noursei]MCE4948747.1 hypothetical protein [Streptomyces noursei]
MAILTARIEERDEPSGKRKSYSDHLWKDESDVKTSVRAVLRRMAPGVLGCCMYCGSTTGTDIEHFEPREKNPAQTFRWSNHLLACGPCNSTYKRTWWECDTETGEPLLIDPTREDPFTHLFLDLGKGTYRRLTRKGQKTIDVLGLNLHERRFPEARRLARKCARRVIRDWGRARRDSDEAGMRDALDVLRIQPFADVWQSMLRQAVMPGADIVMDGEHPEVLYLLRNEELRAATLVDFPVQAAPAAGD